MIAAILDLHGGAGAALDAVDQMQGGFTRRHDVIDDDLLLRGDAENITRKVLALKGRARISPGRDLEFLGIADHAIDFRHGGEGRGLGLRRAAGDHDARLRPFAAKPADGLARLPHRFRRHRAGIYHHRVVETGFAGLAPHDFGFMRY